MGILSKLFGKKTLETPQIDDQLLALLALQAAMGEDGCDTDEIPGGKGEFGLVVSNPVPVQGVMSSEVYLRRLQTAAGEEISWQRIGSFGSENIERPIDGYQIVDARGKEQPTIYISPYHKKTSEKAPMGYTFG